MNVLVVDDDRDSVNPSSHVDVPRTRKPRQSRRTAGRNAMTPSEAGPHVPASA
jgi:hypothetical protein